jgi:alginate O-acetyltransferase complex protein AlgI
MLFTESRFFPFFLAVFCVHWLLRSNTQRKVWLLGASYVFYGAWDWRFLGILMTSTLVDYTVGLRIARSPRPRAWLLGSLTMNLGVLGFFKYFNFFIGSAVDFLHWLGFQAHASTLHIVLPVGVSFYTFQSMSYTIDVYRKKLEPTRSLLDLATFVAFFPQLVAGPIVRAQIFLPQMKPLHRFADVDVRAALALFLAGFFKKACISDNLAPFVDRYFLNPQDYDAGSAWAGTLAYAVQIYSDFSGYTDMALACAALLGYRLTLNFDFPYFSPNITDFWRRWHMSLSSWLRDYLYIPLGGSRGSKLFTYRNLMLTMLLGGLWHGAGWNFVIWGGLHGLALVVHREWAQRVPPRSAPGLGASPLRGAGVVLATLVTFWFVCLCWIFFRAGSLPTALTVVRGYVLFDSPGTLSIGRAFPWIFLGLVALHWTSYRKVLGRWWEPLPSWGFAAVYGSLVALMLPLVAQDYTPFIYFQF